MVKNVNTEDKIKLLKQKGYEIIPTSKITLFESNTLYTLKDPSSKVILDSVEKSYFDKYLENL